MAFCSYNTDTDDRGEDEATRIEPVTARPEFIARPAASDRMPFAQVKFKRRRTAVSANPELTLRSVDRLLTSSSQPNVPAAYRRGASARKDT